MPRVLWLWLALATGCAFDAECPPLASIELEWSEPTNTCPGVRLAPPPSEDCAQTRYLREDCSAEQFYVCRNQMTAVIAVDSGDGSARLLVRDERSGCESFYEN